MSNIMLSNISINSLFLAINSLLFLLTAFYSQSLWNISYKALITFGAKSAPHLYEGEIWRLFTATFLHAGPIHFLLNMIALKMLGPITEKILGSFVFLFIYILSGFFGNLASSFTSLSLSIGASSSIMGLVGVGVILEYLELIKKKTYKQIAISLKELKIKKILYLVLPGPFAMMAFVNILIAIIFNFISERTSLINIGIDNSAHLGGLVAGILITLVWLYSFDNCFFLKRRIVSFLISIKLLASAGGGIYILSQTDFLIQKTQRKISLKQKN